MLWTPLQASAAITFVFNLADWQTELTNAGLIDTLEDFNAFADGALPSFSVAGVNFNSPLSTVSGGALVSDFRVGPDRRPAMNDRNSGLLIGAGITAAALVAGFVLGRSSVSMVGPPVPVASKLSSAPPTPDKSKLKTPDGSAPSVGPEPERP